MNMAAIAPPNTTIMEIGRMYTRALVPLDSGSLVVVVGSLV